MHLHTAELHFGYKRSRMGSKILRVLKKKQQLILVDARVPGTVCVRTIGVGSW